MKKDNSIHFENYSGIDGKLRGVSCRIGYTEIRFRTIGDDIERGGYRMEDGDYVVKLFGLNKDVRDKVMRELKHHLSFRVID